MWFEPFGLRPKDMVAIVTLDPGIGRAIAVLYAREGADLAIIYLNEHQDAEETRCAVEKKGRRCILISGDVSDGEFCYGSRLCTCGHPIANMCEFASALTELCC
jgi:NAD(P)-dependent dehydrogenase (short-subunit alcohol dehydrogenase family)